MRTDPLDLNPDFPGDYLRYLSTFTKSEAFLLNLFSSNQFNLVLPIARFVNINRPNRTYKSTHESNGKDLPFIRGGEKTIYQCRIVHIMRVIS